MPKYTTEKQMTDNNYGVTTYLKFKYEATRSSDAKKVTFKLEPRIRYSGSTTSNAAAVFFNSDYPTTSSTSTVTTFTHSCACNKTYSSQVNGVYKYNWYGGTGTSTASSDTDYPVDGDAWAFGNWSSISIQVAEEKTSVTLYFNFANNLGYGNYENDGKGTKIWNGYAKNYRFGITFEVPVGYTKNGSPTVANAPVLDLPKISGLPTDVASKYFTVNWTKPTTGTNNSIAKYKIHVGVWGKLSGNTEGRVSYLYADNISSSTTSYKIYRSTIESKVGIDANTQYFTPTVPSKYWKCVDVQIEAVDKYGNSTYSAIPGWQVYWNEKPTAPSNIGIKHGTEPSILTWSNSIVEMTDYSYSFIQSTGSIDRWIPEFPTSYNEAYYNPSPYYSYLITRSYDAPSDEDFTKNGVKNGNGYVVWLEWNGLLGEDPEIGLGPYYAHSKAWDGQLYSNDYRKVFYLGKLLVPNGNLSIETENGELSISSLNPSLKLVIPAMYVDGCDATTGKYYYPSPSGNVGINIYAMKENNNGTWSDEYEIYSYSTPALQEDEVLKIPFSNFWNALLSNLQIDLTKPLTTKIRFSIYMYCEKETRLHGRNTSIPVDSHVIKGATVTGALTSANVGNGSTNLPLYYSYGQLTPYITTDVAVTYSINGLPDNQYLTHYIEYADLGTTDNPEDASVTWTSIYYGYSSNISSKTVVLSLPNRAYTVPIKLRLKLVDQSGNISYIGLHWPSYSQATSAAEKCAASAIQTYKIPLVVFQSIATGELSIADDDDANGNKVDFNFTIGDPINYSDNPRFFLLNWYSLFKSGGTGYICGDGTTLNALVSAQYFSGVNPGKYKAPTFFGYLNFTPINQSGSFVLKGAKLGSSYDASMEYNTIQTQEAFAANTSSNVYAIVYCYEVLKTTPRWTELSDFDKDRDKLIQLNPFSITCPISSYANARYQDLNMAAAKINRKNGGALV